MLSCGWRHFAGVVFLAIIAFSGQAQGNPEQSGQPTKEEAGPDKLPLPLPVTIVEPDEVTSSRDSAQAEAEERAKRDLLAQEGMDAAAQKMTKYALWQTWLIAIGTAALIYTLWLTRQANGSALKAVEITRTLGLAEQRPYVQANITQYISHRVRGKDDAVFWRIRVVLSNTGNTPTKGQLVQSCWRLTTEPLETMPEGVPAYKSYVRGKDSYVPLTFDVWGSDLAAVQRGEKFLTVFVAASYGTALDDDARFFTKQAFQATSITGDPTKFWDPQQPLGIDWAIVPTFYCFDEECYDGDPSA